MESTGTGQSPRVRRGRGSVVCGHVCTGVYLCWVFHVIQHCAQYTCSAPGSEGLPAQPWRPTHLTPPAGHPPVINRSGEQIQRKLNKVQRQKGPWEGGGEQGYNKMSSSGVGRGEAGPESPLRTEGAESRKEACGHPGMLRDLLSETSLASSEPLALPPGQPSVFPLLSVLYSCKQMPGLLIHPPAQLCTDALPATPALRTLAGHLNQDGTLC